MSALRPLTRLALRDARRHPWRSLLVVLLIALPVAGFTFGAVGMRTVPDTPRESVAKTMGSADALVQAPPTQAGRIASRLGSEGFRVVRWEVGTGVLRTTGTGGADRVTTALTGLDLRDPLAAGLWELRSGRLPARPGEVVLTGAAASRLGVGVGAEVTLEPNRPLRVVGVVLAPDIEARGAVGPALTDAATLEGVSLLVGGGPGAVELQRLLDPLVSPDVGVTFNWGALASPGLQADDQALLYMVGTLGLMAFGLVVAAALAVGARRQLRVLGLLGAAGASPRQRSGATLLQGAALGLLGTAIGLPAGVVVWNAARDRLEEFWGQRIGATLVDGGDLLLIGALAIAVAVAASMLPARVAARTSVLQALGGRRPTPRVRVRMPVAGVAVSTAGLVMLAEGIRNPPAGGGVPLLATAGIALTVIGATITVPYLVGLLERVAGGLAGTGRLAVRDVARHRGRTGPVVAAVMAAGALAIAAGAVGVSADADRGADRQDPRVVNLSVATGERDSLSCDRLTGLAEPIGRVLPGARTACLRLLSINTSVPVVAVDAAEMDALGLGAYRDELAAGRLLALQATGFPTTPPAQVEFTSFEGRTLRREVSREQLPPVVSSRLAGYVLADAAVVDRILPGWERRLPLSETTLVYRLPGPVNDAQRAALSRLSDDLALQLGAAPGSSLTATLEFDRGGFSLSRLVYAVILPAALALSILVVLVGLALVAADGREERATLVAVGAAPGHRRRMQAVRAFVLTGMGQALAVPVGLACAWVTLRVQDVAFVVPWPLVGALAVALPVAAAAIGAVLVRREVPALERRLT